MNNLNEKLLRKKSLEQLKKLNTIIKKSGGDINDKIKKSEKTKESDLPNSYYLDNPLDSNRKIDTFENFNKPKNDNTNMITKFNEFNSNDILESKNIENVMNAKEIKQYIIDNFKNKNIKREDELDNIIARIINKFGLSDKTEKALKGLVLNYVDYDINENIDDNNRPMYKNIPEDNLSYNPLTTGKYIKFANIEGQIQKIDEDNGFIYIDVIENNKHTYKKFKIKDIIKSLQY